MRLREQSDALRKHLLSVVALRERSGENYLGRAASGGASRQRQKRRRWVAGSNLDAAAASDVGPGDLFVLTYDWRNFGGAQPDDYVLNKYPEWRSPLHASERPAAQLADDAAEERMRLREICDSVASDDDDDDDDDDVAER
jgi:hypothetical protein